MCQSQNILGLVTLGLAHVVHTPHGPGEFTTGFFEKVFMELDNECDGHLSQGRYLKQKVKWANTETWLNWCFLFLFGLVHASWIHMYDPIVLLLEEKKNTLPNRGTESQTLNVAPSQNWVTRGSQEAYVLFGILGYARKYWRKSLCKKTVTWLQCSDIYAIHLPSM